MTEACGDVDGGAVVATGDVSSVNGVGSVAVSLKLAVFFGFSWCFDDFLAIFVCLYSLFLYPKFLCPKFLFPKFPYPKFLFPKSLK